MKQDSFNRGIVVNAPISTILHSGLPMLAIVAKGVLV